MLSVNGRPAPEGEGRSLSDYLAGAGYRPDRVAVEIGGEIVPKSAYDGRVLGADDTVEVVQFMGGG